MTENEARQWLGATVPRGTLARLEDYAELVTQENQRQNLIAASTIASIWSRHILDSAQLDPLLAAGPLIDLGSGAGFPGIVLAIVGGRPVRLIEPRRKRADFLLSCVAALGLPEVEVVQARAESVAAPPAATITARAVAPLDALFAAAEHLADAATRWVLPKGRNAQSELAKARDSWHGDFRLVASVTDSAAAIVVAQGVRRKAPQGGVR